MEAAAIQCLFLMVFIKLLCLVDESTVILPYKIFFAVKGDVLFELESWVSCILLSASTFKVFALEK